MRYCYLLCILLLFSCSSTKYNDSSNNLRKYYLKSKLYFENNNYRLALKYINKVIKIEPNNSDNYYNRALIYIYLKEYNKAIKDLDISINLSPFDDAFFNYGFCLKRLNKFNESIIYFTKAINLMPSDSKYYFNRAVSYEKLNKYDIAINDYSKAIDLDPKFIEAYINRGNLYEEKKEWEKALNDYMKAYAIDSSDFELLSIITNFYYLPIFHSDYDKENIFKDNEKSLHWANKLFEELEKQKKSISKDLKVDFAEYYYTVFNVYDANYPLPDIKDTYEKLKLIKKATELNPKNENYKKQYKLIKKMYNILKTL